MSPSTTSKLNFIGKVIGYGFMTSIVGYSASILLATPNNKIIKLNYFQYCYRKNKSLNLLLPYTCSV